MKVLMILFLFSFVFLILISSIASIFLLDEHRKNDDSEIEIHVRIKGLCFDVKHKKKISESESLADVHSEEHLEK